MEIIESLVSVADPFLTFCSTLLWQIIVVAIAYKYREELSNLLDKRLAKIKIGNTEIDFRQEESAEAESPGGEFEKQIQTDYKDGFFTKKGISQIIEKSALKNPKEKVIDLFLLFKTSKQRTWLVFTNERLWCILDSEKTQTNKRLIQWKLYYDEITRINAKESARKSGRMLVDIGPRTNWLYSPSLHPDQEDLENEIRSLIERAKLQPSE